MTCHTSPDPGPQELQGRGHRRVSAPRVWEPRREPEARAGGEQEPGEGAGLSRLVSGTVWEGSMCVKLGEETQLPKEANRVQAGREEGASQLHRAGLSHGGERRERPAWGSARSSRRCEGLSPGALCPLRPSQPREGSWGRRALAEGGITPRPVGHLQQGHLGSEGCPFTGSKELSRKHECVHPGAVRPQEAAGARAPPVGGQAWPLPHLSPRKVSTGERKPAALGSARAEQTSSRIYLELL